MFSTFNSNASSWKPVQAPPPTAQSDHRIFRKAKRSQVAQACVHCRSQRIRCSNVKPCKSCTQKGINCIAPAGHTFRPNPSPNVTGSFSDVDHYPTPDDETHVELRTENTSFQSEIRAGTFNVSFRALFKHVNEYANQVALGANLPWNAQACNSTYTRLFVGEKINEQGSTQAQTNHLKLQRAAVYTVQLYWHSFHVLYPILEEAAVKTTLYNADGQFKPSVLLDIGLALCQQLTPAGSRHSSGRPEGWDDYIRFEGRLAHMSLDPSLVDLQALTMATVYLERVGRTFAASTKLATAVHVARSLQDDPDKQPANEAERTLRARIWICLYVVDTRISMDLGCQHQVDEAVLAGNRSQAESSIPGEPEYASRENVKWLDYHVWMAILMQALRGVQKGQVNRVQVSASSGLEESRQLDAEARAYNRETLGDFFKWRATVPETLITPHTDSTPGLSLHSSPMKINSSTPMWVHRQRFSTQIVYNEVKMSLYLGFFRLPQTAKSSAVESHQIACLQHAIVNVGVIDQIVSEFDTIEAAPQFVRHLFRAALCIIAFILAQPSAPLADGALKALQTVQKALRTLEEKCNEASVLMEYIFNFEQIIQSQA